MNEYLNVLQSLQLPFAMLPTLFFCSRAHLLGEFRSTRGGKYLSRALALTVMCTNLYLVFEFVIAKQASANVTFWVCLYTAAYFLVCGAMINKPIARAFTRSGARLLATLGGGPTRGTIQLSEAATETPRATAGYAPARSATGAPHPAAPLGKADEALMLSTSARLSSDPATPNGNPNPISSTHGNTEGA